MFNVSPFSSSFPPQAPKEYSSLLRKRPRSPVNTNIERMKSDSFELKFGMDPNDSSLIRFVQFYENERKKNPLSSQGTIINNYMDKEGATSLLAKKYKNDLSRYLSDPYFRQNKGLEEIYQNNHDSNAYIEVSEANRNAKIDLRGRLKSPLSS